ncbi:MAG: galactokinase [Oscillospiraceae bacterium]|nr:galactokinase [Oscillospiraceae bacterium]
MSKIDKYTDSLSELYGDLESAKSRYSELISEFERIFGKNREIMLISAPGRTEIGGNHTDHQRGTVLAAAVELDVICAVARRAEPEIQIVSEGYPPDVIQLFNDENYPEDEDEKEFYDLKQREDEVGTTAGLIRGVAEWFVLNGFKIGGLDAYISSQVIVGSGLSSSAAFEVALGGMFNHLYNGGKATAREIAVMGQYAENTHFGKPSGLMDQMASSVGGFVHMDFSEPGNIIIKPVEFDLCASGYALCITDTKGSHADLTDEYTVIPYEMSQIAEYFGKSFLSEVDSSDFYAAIPDLREKSENGEIDGGDRAVLRALHFFDENERVGLQANALENGDVEAFLKLVNESGDSSFQYLQNVYSNSDPCSQGLSLALALSKRILQGRGACRVHGGGFAGTVQAFVPNSLVGEYRAEMERVFGAGTCNVLKVRNAGGVRLNVN